METINKKIPGGNWYKGSRFTLLILNFLLILGCGSNKNFNDSPTIEDLKGIVYEQGFEIESQWANPLSGSMINLIGNPNYLRFTRDSVDIYLPYFGVRRTGGGYGNREGGIVYKGIPQDLQIMEENKNMMLRFRGKHGSEDLRFIITLYPDGGANTSINSSERDAISYRGSFTRHSQKQKQKVDVLLDKQVNK